MESLNKVIIITAKSKSNFIDFHELWNFRELFYIFGWRDVKIRYKQTLIGVSWIIIQPLLSMMIFSLLFEKFININNYNIPYPLFLLTGLIFWTFFSSTLINSSNSLLTNENLIKKVYFPKLILPISVVITGLLDLTINVLIFMTIVLLFKQVITIWLLLMLFFGALIIFLMISGLGLYLSAVNVKYRDVRYVLPFFVQLMFFLSPIIYSAQNLDPTLRYLLALNPLTGVIESLRSILGSTSINYELLTISLLSALGMFIYGILFFNLAEKEFADLI